VRWLGLSLLTLLVACAAVPRAGSADRVAGTVHDDGERPLGNVQVVISPLEPLGPRARSEPEPLDRLRGVSVTDPDGRFEITGLASSHTFEEYPLLRGWRYEVRAQLSGYQLWSNTFDFTRGGLQLTVHLEPRPDEDEESVLPPPDPNDPTRCRGRDEEGG